MALLVSVFFVRSWNYRLPHGQFQIRSLLRWLVLKEIGDRRPFSSAHSRWQLIRVFPGTCSLLLAAAMKFAYLLCVAILLSLASRVTHGQHTPFDGANTLYSTTNLIERPTKRLKRYHQRKVYCFLPSYSPSTIAISACFTHKACQPVGQFRLVTRVCWRLDQQLKQLGFGQHLKSVAPDH